MALQTQSVSDERSWLGLQTSDRVPRPSSWRRERLTPYHVGVIYFWLMSDDVPPEPLRNFPPYVTSEEAIRWAAKEARRRGEPVHIFRVQDDHFESQPWRTEFPAPE